MDNEVCCQECYEWKPKRVMGVSGGGKTICHSCTAKEKKHGAGRRSVRLQQFDEFALHMIAKDMRGQYVDEDFDS